MDCWHVQLQKLHVDEKGTLSCSLALKKNVNQTQRAAIRVKMTEDCIGMRDTGSEGKTRQDFRGPWKREKKVSDSDNSRESANI